MNPPEKALLLCVDEKSQIQALDRIQPTIALASRHSGTTNARLHKAPRVYDNPVRRPQPDRWKCSSRSACRATAIRSSFDFCAGSTARCRKILDLHIVLDNYGTHTHDAVRKWLEARPRFHLHFTPTSASWLNLVERFFAGNHRTSHSSRHLSQRYRTGERGNRLHPYPESGIQSLSLGR